MPTVAGTAVVTPSPTPEPIKVVPTPNIMQATVYGYIFRPEGTGAAQETVLFCQDFSLYWGCGDKTYEVMTDEDGFYIFTDVEPGEYTLVMEAVGGTEAVQYSSDLGRKVKTFAVGRGQMRLMEPMVLFVPNLQAIAPMATVTVPTPIADNGILTHAVDLRWQPYGETAVYEVYLSPVRGDVVFVNEQVAEERITAVLPRLNCLYDWQVVALDSDHIKIAQTQTVTFTVTGAEIDCDVVLLPPRIGEVISETIKPVILDWEVHEMADTYHVWLVDAKQPQRPPILDFKEVSRSRFELGNGLRASQYLWAVMAFDENGRMIAESEVDEFRVDEMGEIVQPTVEAAEP